MRSFRYTVEKNKGLFTRNEHAEMYNTSALMQKSQISSKQDIEAINRDPAIIFFPSLFGDIRILADNTSDFSKIIQTLQVEAEAGLGGEYILKLIDQKKVSIENDLRIKSFSKTVTIGGDEKKAEKVFYEIIKFTEKLKYLTITLWDDGKFLYCPIKISNGFIKPCFDKKIGIMQNRIAKSFREEEITEEEASSLNGFLNKMDFIGLKEEAEKIASKPHFSFLNYLTRYCDDVLQMWMHIGDIKFQELKEKGTCYIYNREDIHRSTDSLNKKFRNIDVATDGLFGQGYNMITKEEEEQEAVDFAYFKSTIKKTSINLTRIAK